MKILDIPQSGSIGGQTSSHNRAGQYRRNRRTPVVPTRTPKQGILRSRFTNASSLWQSIGPALQAAWTSFAAGYPVVDSLGQSIVLTGQQFFVAVQTTLLNAMQLMLTNVPTNTTVFAVDTPVVYADDAGFVIGSLATIDPSGFCLFAASKLLGLGRFFNKTVSQFGVIVGPGTFVDASTVYAAQFGTPTVGRKLFAQFKSVNSNGLSGPPVRVSSLVTPAGSIAAPVLTSPAAGSVTASVPLTGTYTVVIFQVPPSGQAAVSLAQSYDVAAPGAAQAVPTGSQVYARICDGTTWSPASAIITVT